MLMAILFNLNRIKQVCKRIVTPLVCVDLGTSYVAHIDSLPRSQLKPHGPVGVTTDTNQFPHANARRSRETAAT